MTIALPDGPVFWTGNEALGRYLLGLYADRSWLLRRVETVSFLDGQRLERRVTLDIDCVELARRAMEVGLAPSAQDTLALPIPIALLPKTLLLDIDVHDAAGQALPVAISGRDSAAAQLLMLAQVAEFGVDPDSLGAVVQQKLFDIAARIPSTEDRRAVEDDPGGEVSVAVWTLAPSLSTTAAEVDAYFRLFEHREFVELALTFTAQYQLMTTVPIDQGRVSLVKLRHVESIDSELLQSWTSRWGLESFAYLIDAPAFSNTAREHFRVIAPPETRIVSAQLITLTSSSSQGGQISPPPLSSRVYWSRTTPGRAVVYARGLLPANYMVLVSLRPQRSSFVRPAMIALLGSLILLLSGIVAECRSQVLTSRDSSVEATVVILALFPTILSAYIAREGEHAIVRKLLFYPRVAVLLSAGATLMAAGSLILKLSSLSLSAVWSVFALVNATTLLLLLSIDRRTGTAVADVLSNQDSTQELPVPRF